MTRQTKSDLSYFSVTLIQVAPENNLLYEPSGIAYRVMQRWVCRQHPGWVAQLLDTVTSSDDLAAIKKRAPL